MTPRRRSARVERATGARVARDAVLRADPGARIVLGPHAVIGRRCELVATAGATIRVDGVLGDGCRLAARAEICVGVGAYLGDHCALIDFDHIADDPERPVRRQGLVAGPVRVEAGALLGPGVAVLRGRTVGAGATVLANSVVTRDVPAGAQAAGAPARLLGADSPSVHRADPEP